MSSMSRLVVGFAVLALSAPITVQAEALERSKENSIKVAIDRNTGRMRAPTQAELDELRRMELAEEKLAKNEPNADSGIQARSNGTGLRRFPSGYTGMEVPRNLHSVLTARLDASGAITIEHSDPEGSSYDR